MLKFFRITAVVLLIAWMSLIFCLSNQVAEDSSQTSGRIIKMVVSFFYSDFNELSEAEQAEIIAPFQFIARKSAHFALYFILGALAYLSLVTYKSPPLFCRTFISAVICLLYSVSDEIHQRFVSGRSGEIRDVCIDFAGSSLAIIFLYLITRLILKKRNTDKKVKKMKKKDLLKLNQDLFSQLDNAKLAVENIKKENEELKIEIEKLKQPPQALRDNGTVTEPIKKLEEKLIKQAGISDETQYGAAVIGKIVVSAARHCNKLTALNSGSENIKELVNLILGRTEVAKAEILEAVSNDSDFEEKKNLIDAKQQAAEDYFNSVCAQIG